MSMHVRRTGFCVPAVWVRVGALVGVRRLRTLAMAIVTCVALCTSATPRAPAEECAWDPSMGVPGMTESDGAGVVVRALRVFDDGTSAALYAGGIFTRSGETPVGGIAKWDGARWTEVGGGVSDPARVYALLAVDNGLSPKLYVSGSFTSAGSIPANAVAMWDGQSWSSLGDGLRDGFRQTIVFALALYDDGGGPALFAAGRFKTAGDQAVNHVAKWDGQAWFDVGGGMDGMIEIDRVNALCVYDDGNGPALYVGGMFTGAGGVESPGIAKWDGTSWSDVGGSMGGSHPYVRALHVFDDGNGPALIVGGNFTSAGGVETIKVAKWDGAEWSAMGEGFGGPNPWVTSFEVFDERTGPKLFACGKFAMSGETVVNRIARWTGAAWTPLRDGVDGNIYAVTVFNNEDVRTLTVGGLFIFADHQPANRVAQWSCPEPLAGDTDSDGDVDLFDYRNFTRCMRGPGQATLPACLVLDFDEDFDVDWSDFGSFQTAFTGPL